MCPVTTSYAHVPCDHRCYDVCSRLGICNMYPIVVLCFAVVRRTYVPHCHSNIDHRQRSSNAASIIAIGTVTIDHRQRSGNATSIIACGAVTINHRQRIGNAAATQLQLLRAALLRSITANAAATHLQLLRAALLRSNTANAVASQLQLLRAALLRSTPGCTHAPSSADSCTLQDRCRSDNAAVTQPNNVAL